MKKKSTQSGLYLEPSQQIYKSGVQIWIDNLIGGVAWGVGSVIGATIVVGVLGFALARAKTIPFVGTIIQNVITQMSTDQL